MPFVCVVNLGLYRTGTTSLAMAAKRVGMNQVFRSFPNLDHEKLKCFAFQPTAVIDAFIASKEPDEGIPYFVDAFTKFDFVCDGWFAMIALASDHMLEYFMQEVKKRGITLTFVATNRDYDSYIQSDLHHWVRHNLEAKACLNSEERASLERALEDRYKKHHQGMKRIEVSFHFNICNSMVPMSSSLKEAILPNKIPFQELAGTLVDVGKQNESPPSPVEGILLTMRITDEFAQKFRNIQKLFEDIEQDILARCIVILAFDDDEFNSPEAQKLHCMISERPCVKSVHLIRNPKVTSNSPFPICHIWHHMAIKAWTEGASWVVLLGDDIRIHSPFHFRAIYRAFLDIQEKLGIPSGLYFGCPWFKDLTFPGFPTFPIVGREHYRIFNGLIPENRISLFMNQDLDPYLQRLYLKYGAGPQLTDVSLSNGHGGTNSNEARYSRVPATSWREDVLDDVSPIHTYLQQYNLNVDDLMETLLDVVIPTYRVNVKYLERLCSLHVPGNMKTTFIIIADNPSLLIKTSMERFTENQKIIDSDQAANLLESHLTQFAHSVGENNSIRVRCNQKNLGVCATRNRGINESAAEWILNLDDDVIPSTGLLDAYNCCLQDFKRENVDILGLIGLVRFPRSNDMPVIHAAVVMSYLTFMFEIAENDMYSKPPWGVTANILYKKVEGMSFDTRYANPGGGEDVDFALQMAKETGLQLRSAPAASVEHPFWEGGFYALCKHFFRWAVGDGKLYYSFPEHVYCSFPNFVETWIIWILFVFPVIVAFTIDEIQATNDFSSLIHLITTLVIPTLLVMLLVDVIIDVSWSWGGEFKHRILLITKGNPTKFSYGYFLFAHVLANAYMIVLECGRLYGHLRRGQYHNMLHRFDWHCGCHKNSKRNFVLREGCKFIAFVLVIYWFSFSK